MDPLLAGGGSSELIAFLLDVSIRGSFIILLTLLATVMFIRRLSATVRSWIWTLALCAVICVPPLLYLLPQWQIPLLPKLDLSEQEQTGILAVPDELLEYLQSTETVPLEIDGVDVDSIMGDTDAFRLPLPDAIVLIWIFGASIYVLWLAVGRLGAWWIVRRAEPPESSWIALCRRMKQELGIRRPIKILRSGLIAAAFTVGIFRPVIVLPRKSNEWLERKKSIVLRHELSHIRRNDMLYEFPARLAEIFFWFNPLVWIAAYSLRVERERACDDAVLNSGTKPSEYAKELMGVAADVGAFSRPAWQAAVVSEGSNLRDRLHCILDPRLNRSSGNRLTIFLLLLVSVSAVVLFSAFDFWDGEVVTEQQASIILTPSETREALDDLVDINTGIRRTAMSRLLSADRSQTGAILFEILRHPDKTVRDMAINIFADLDERKTGDLLKTESYSNGDETIRERARAQALRIKSAPSVHEKINTLGYALLRSGRTDDAIEIFKLNVKAFPQSSNAYDSLAEGYLETGNPEEAIMYYQKSLELNPENDNAKKMLRYLESNR